jgi:hypothetical protein
MDADMLCLCDVYDLAPDRALYEYPVSVVKNPQLRFEWPSLMLFNNEKCTGLTPEYIDDPDSKPMSFDWIDWVAGVGELPAEYNHCVGYDKPREDAKIVHFTQGIPCFPETKDSEYGQAWIDEFNMCRSSVSWAEIMGNSIHAKPVMERLGRVAH